MNPGILQIHAMVSNLTGLQIFASRVDLVGYTYPFIAYTPVTDNRWKDYQAQTRIYEEAGELRKLYEYSVTLDMQYSYVDSSSAEFAQRLYDNTNALYTAFGRDEVRAVARTNRVGVSILSPILEDVSFQDNIGEVQHSFDVRYYYMYTVDVPDVSGVIESVNFINLNEV